MLHHVSVGVADVPRAAKFYDAVLGTLGYKRVMEFMPYAIAYGENAPSFWVQLPNDKNSASVGNGVHIGFIARSRQAVQDFHANALANGGNKLEATLMETAAAGGKSPEEKRKAKEARKAAKAAKAAQANVVSDKKKNKDKAARKATKKAKGEKDKSGKKKRTPEEKAERRKQRKAKKT